RFSTAPPGGNVERMATTPRAQDVTLRFVLLLVAWAARAGRDAAARAPDECEEVLDIRRAHLVREARDRVGEVRPRPEEDAERDRQGAYALTVEARAAEPDSIEPAHDVRLVADRERRHVARRAREPAHDREPPDPAMLMDDAVTGDERLVLDDDVAP